MFAFHEFSTNLIIFKMTRKYFRRADDDDDAQIVIDFLSSGKRTIAFWAENIREPSRGEFKNYIKYKTFTTKITNYLSENKLSLSEKQKERNSISAADGERFATIYSNVSEQGTLKINMQEFYEDYIIVQPYDNAPSFKAFMGKLKQHQIWNTRTISNAVTGIDLLLSAEELINHIDGEGDQNQQRIENDSTNATDSNHQLENVIDTDLYVDVNTDADNFADIAADIADRGLPIVLESFIAHSSDNTSQMSSQTSTGLVASTTKNVRSKYKINIFYYLLFIFYYLLFIIYFVIAYNFKLFTILMY